MTQESGFTAVFKVNSSRANLITACSHHILSNVREMTLLSFPTYAHSSQVLHVAFKARQSMTVAFHRSRGRTWSAGHLVLWGEGRGGGNAQVSAFTVAPWAQPTHCDRDIQNEPNIISIEIVSRWECFVWKIIPHQHQQPLLQQDRMPLLMSAAQHGATVNHHMIPPRFESASYFRRRSVVMNTS